MRFFYALTILSLFVSLQARENPFKPVIDNTVLPIASNQVKKAPPFKSVKVSLPNDARVLTSIAVYYQSIDGSIKKRVVPVDRSIDWHKPLLISQTPLRESPAAAKKAKAAKKPQHKETPAKREKAEKTYRPLPFLQLKVGKKSVRIVTKDKKIRSFHLSRPFKVAVDFRRKAGFLTKHIPLSGAPFKSIDIGNHNGYYRVVVTLDAPYRYKIIQEKDGYTLALP
ncbi:AMIN domain-containing protein [Hydrogenimonas sp.]